MAPAAPPENDDLDEVLDLEPRSRRSDRRRGRGGHGSERDEREPMRRWRSSADDDEAPDEVLDGGGPGRPREKPPVFWRARDSLYFEPLVALAIIVLLLVSLFAYTSNWPPVYVVESNSMQHGPGDHLGDLNAGDVVLAQKTSLSSIVTYVQGAATGYGTYGSYGDVLLYYPNGSSSATPIVHRAIVFLEYNPRNNTFNATGLTPAECGTGSPYLYETPQTAGRCGTVGLGITDSLEIFGIEGRTLTVDFSCTTNLGDHSGFVTLGDNNSAPDQFSGGCGPPPLSTLVEPGWVIGVARGMLPWFGALKLLLDGNAGKVPTASWEFLGLTIAGIIFAGAGLHVLLRRRRAEHRRVRRRNEEEEDEEEPEPAPRSKAPRGLGAVQPWNPAPEPAEPGEPAATRAPARTSHEQRRRAHFTSTRERRPARRPDRDRNPSDEEDDGDEAADGGRSRL